MFCLAVCGSSTQYHAATPNIGPLGFTGSTALWQTNSGVAIHSKCLAASSSFGVCGTLGWLKQNFISGSGQNAFLKTSITFPTSLDVAAIGKIVTGMAVDVMAVWFSADCCPLNIEEREYVQSENS
jgi:hypothetical protein